MTEVNQNIDLQQTELKQINATELKNLIQEFELQKNSTYNYESFDLDNNAQEISKTEQKIIEKLQKLWNIDEQIQFLKTILEKVEYKTMNSQNITTIIIGPDGTSLNPEVAIQQTDIIYNIEQITLKYNSLDELLKNKEDRRKVLEIDYPDWNCPSINFKNWENFIDLSILKQKIAQTENQEIASQLEWILPEEDLQNILDGSCKAENLREKLKTTNKFNDFEVESLINSVALNKKTLSQIFLRNKLKEKQASLEEFLNLEDEKQRVKFLKDKWFNETESKKIIEQYSILKETTKAELETEINMLKFGLEWYNHFSAEYFEKSPDDIKLITDENKVKEVFESLIKKDPEWFKKLLKDNHLPNLVNPKFSSDLDFVKDFALLLNNNWIKEKLDFFDIKNIKFDNNENKVIEQLISLFNIVDENTIKILLNKLLSNIISYQNLVKDSWYQKLLKNSSPKTKKVIEKYSKDYFQINWNLTQLENPWDSDNFSSIWNENSEKNLNFTSIHNENIDYFNLTWNLKNFYWVDNFESKKILYFTEWKNIELNKLEESIFYLLKWTITNEELLKLDSFFFTYVQKNPEKFLNTFSSNLEKILLLPKTLNVIVNTSKILNKFIKINPKLYSLLPESRKENLSTKYADIILKSNTLTTQEKINFLAKIKFKDVKQKNIIFNKFNKYLKKEEFKLLFKNPSFSLYYAEFLEKNKEKILKSNTKENTNLENNAIKENKKDLEQIEKAYTESNIEESAEKVSEKENTENNEWIFIKKWKEIWNMIEKYFQDSPELQEKFILIIQDYLKNPSNIRNLFNIEFWKALWIEKYTIFLKDFKKIIDEYLSSPIKTTKKEQKWAEKKYFDENWEMKINKLKDEYIYLLALEKQNAEKKEQEFNIEIFTKNFLRKKFPNISEKKLNKIASKIIYEYWGWKEKLENASNNKELIQAVVHWDTEKINKYLDKIDKETDKKIYKQAKYIKEKQEKENQNVKKTQTSEKTSILADNYNPETWAIVISEDWETDTIKLSPEEQKLVKNNPETLDNIIDFYKVLSRLWLKKLWTIKEQIFKSIENVMWIWFRIDWNYLNENEIKIFLNAILKSIWKEEIPMIFTLENFLWRIEILNKTQAISWTEATKSIIYDETLLENMFFNKFVPRNNPIIGFNFAKFEESLSWKQKN